MMRARQAPLDLINGQQIDIDKSLAWSNDKEFHHLFPQAYLARNRVGANESNRVANIILLTSASNITIRDKAPSDYLNIIIENSGRSALVQRLRSNLVYEEALDAALADNYESFLRIRSESLHHYAQGLIGCQHSDTESGLADEIDDSDEDFTE
jgi:hypothetical protein